VSDPVLFKASIPEDPAVPGDPFQRLRYHYGMLLGAEDFSVEQRERVLRRRLHNALLHGAGTVWGLAVAVGDVDLDGRHTQIVVHSGLAVDALGREIYVDQKQCLDVTGLARHAVWAELKAPDGTTNGTVRRTYVVLRYEACQAQPVPAIAAPCDEPGDAVAYSRVLDRFRIELSATPPGDPHPLQRDYFAAFLAAKPDKAPRDVLLEFLLREPPAPGLSAFWSKAQDAPLLLATLDLDISGTGTAAKAFAVEPSAAVVNPDSRVRALLPSVQIAAEALLGERLVGLPLARSGLSPTLALPFQVVRWSAVSGTEIHVTFSATPSAAVLAQKPVSLARLDAGGWTDLGADLTVALSGNDLVLTLGGTATLGDGTAAVTYQVHVRGEGFLPLVSDKGAALLGVVGDPLIRAGRGRDVSIIDTWKSV
jgi:hypothetical protein